MKQLSRVTITALIGTIFLGLAFLIMPLVSMNIGQNSAFIISKESALSLVMNQQVTRGYGLSAINLLTPAVIIAVVAMLVSFIPMISRTARYILMIAGFLAVIGYGYILYIPIADGTNLIPHLRKLDYGFWIGLLASIALIVQGFMDREPDVFMNVVIAYSKKHLSVASITALVATIFLGLAFLTMPIITAPVIENDAFVLTEEGDNIYESITALSLTFDNAPEFEYSLPTIGLLSFSVLIAVIAMAASFVPAITRISRYVLMLAGLLTLFGFFAVPLQIIETEITNYAQMLGYGFWVGVLAAIVLIAQGVMGSERDPITDRISNFAKNVRITRQQVIATILLVIGLTTLWQGMTAFKPGEVTSDNGEVVTAETITTTLNFTPHGFRENPDEAEPLQMIVPTGLFLTLSGMYFVAVGGLGIANIDAVKRVMPILLILSAVMIFLVLLVGTAAGGSTNATTMITESLRAATPIAIGAMAGIWCERSGVINIAIEGMMLFGAAIGFTTLFLLQTWYPDPDLLILHMVLGVSFAVLSGGLVSLLHAWLSITFSTDQIVSGTVINILALGSTSYIRAEVLLSSEAGLNKLPIMEIPIFSKLPVIGPIFASQPIFYMMFVVIILTHVMLYHTRWGLRTIAVGENPHAADTLGIKVNRIRWINVFIGGMIAGLAGAWFSLEATGRFTDGMTDGKGFISLAAMIFGKWTPAGSFGGSLLFGFSETLGLRFQILNVALPPQFLQMVPYLVTLIVLAGLVGRAIPPKAIGQPYKTEGSR